jgi:hypothetical protein
MYKKKGDIITEYITERKFYHIQIPGKRNWKLNGVYEFGKEYTDYMKLCLKEDFYNGTDNIGYSKRQILQALIQYYNGEETIKRPQFRELYDNIQGILKMGHSAITHSNKIIRELVFENIRKDYYPEYPSRLSSVWLIPMNPNSLEYWKKSLPAVKNSRILEISATGKIHRGSDKFLSIDECSLHAFVQNAHKYWEGCDSLDKKSEIIFSGSLKVIKVLETIS